MVSGNYYEVIEHTSLHNGDIRAIKSKLEPLEKKL